MIKVEKICLGMQPYGCFNQVLTSLQVYSLSGLGEDDNTLDIRLGAAQQNNGKNITKVEKCYKLALFVDY